MGLASAPLRRESRGCVFQLLQALLCLVAGVAFRVVIVDRIEGVMGRAEKSKLRPPSKVIDWQGPPATPVVPPKISAIPAATVTSAPIGVRSSTRTA